MDPFCEAVVPGKLPLGLENEINGLCAPFAAVNSKGLLVANAAVTVMNDMVPIRVFNGTNQPKSIRAGERLGTFQCWDDQIEILDDDFDMSIKSKPSNKASSKKEI